MVGALLAPGSGWAAASGDAVSRLRCEDLRNPEGIDAPRPSLSWVLDSTRRGARQISWQVLVASSPESLARGRADLWDSGRVDSDQSLRVPYAGVPLRSWQACWWKVRVWNESGDATAWSVPAQWSMGLLEVADWRASWIGRDDPAQGKAFTGMEWIWFPEADARRSAPLGTRYFRRVFDVPADVRVKSATLQLTGDNEFAAAVNGKHATAGHDFHSVASVDVKASLRPGRNVLAAWVKNVGNEPNPAGLLGRLTIELESGPALVIPTDAQWTSADRDMSGWVLPEFAETGWRPVQVLGTSGAEPWGKIKEPDDRRLPARWLRKEFAVNPGLRRATVAFSGLGLSELYVNGRKVGDAVLSPALSDYTKRAFYVTHDVTKQMRRGANALGVVLGNGRYFAPRPPAGESTVSYGYPKLRLQLRLEFADGTVQEIQSDPSWKLTDAGPIRANNEYDGEEYDARRELRGWAESGFDDRGWDSARAVVAPGGVMSAPMIEPIRVTETLRPVAVTEPKPGVFIFDLGQNLVGWCRLTVRGPRGTEVRLRHAETLKRDGTLYLDNLRAAKVTDVYTLKGGGTEVWEPRFTYHGFRYVEVTGYPGRPPLSAIAGRVVHDDLERTGSFFCANPVVNRTWSNVLWGVRGNYRSLPTDCPQRDERQGWLGDRAAESRGESYFFDTSALYRKWLQDMADAQKDNGSIPDVCPAYWPFYSDNVTWPSAAVIIPGALFEHYADRSTVARMYPAMAKWIAHMELFVTNGITERDQYGDWCVPPEKPSQIHSEDPARKTAKGLLATSYLQHCLTLMARYAELTGRSAEADGYRQRAAAMKQAFNARFFQADKGWYDNGSQTACVLPLAFGLVPENAVPRVQQRLVDKIERETHGHVGTGLIGGQWLNCVLTDLGRSDLAWGFATNTSYPSWGYMSGRGATTIWELWNGDTADPAMNSGNHVMLVGDLITWLHERVGGIAPDPAQPGFKHIVMRPELPGDLRFAHASHRSPYGEIRSQWQREGGVFRWQVRVPPNTSATVFVPASSESTVNEAGQPAHQSPGVKFIAFKAGRAIFEVVSGTYAFESR